MAVIIYSGGISIALSFVYAGEFMHGPVMTSQYARGTVKGHGCQLSIQFKNADLLY